jgi:hypothetical protein
MHNKESKEKEGRKKLVFLCYHNQDWSLIIAILG